MNFVDNLSIRPDSPRKVNGFEGLLVQFRTLFATLGFVVAVAEGTGCATLSRGFKSVMGTPEEKAEAALMAGNIAKARLELRKVLSPEAQRMLKDLEKTAQKMCYDFLAKAEKAEGRENYMEALLSLRAALRVLLLPEDQQQFSAIQKKIKELEEKLKNLEKEYNKGKDEMRKLLDEKGAEGPEAEEIVDLFKNLSQLRRQLQSADKELYELAIRWVRYFAEAENWESAKEMAEMASKLNLNVVPQVSPKDRILFDYASLQAKEVEARGGKRWREKTERTRGGERRGGEEKERKHTVTNHLRELFQSDPYAAIVELLERLEKHPGNKNLLALKKEWEGKRQELIEKKLVEADDFFAQQNTNEALRGYVEILRLCPDASVASKIRAQIEILEGILKRTPPSTVTRRGG